VDDAGRLYIEPGAILGTHLALRWKGRVRYVIPRQAAGQRACWQLFHPGLLGIPLRMMAYMPRVFNSQSCREGDSIAYIRAIIGEPGSISACRAGSAGVWLKDTLLFMNHKTGDPSCIVKIGEEAAVGFLLENERNWLAMLSAQPTLAEHVPTLVAYDSTDTFCFVAQRPMTGSFEKQLGPPQFDFLRRLQDYSVRWVRYRDSRLSRTLHMRAESLSGRLPEEWGARINNALLHLERSFGEEPIPMVAAHNDFTPWNVRIRNGKACVFDWEFADHEQFPLFDPLHYILGPLAMHSRPAEELERKMLSTISQCEGWLGRDRCYQAESQALAYMLHLCNTYQWADGGTNNSHPSLVSYTPIIDRLLQKAARAVNRSQV
jgi:hypothetical protein